MSSSTRLLLIIAIILLVLPNVAAFGAGDIPDFSYLNEKAFRHGDIESILENLLKSVGTGGGILGFAKSVMNSEGPKFKKSDVQKVYFVCRPSDRWRYRLLTRMLGKLAEGLFPSYGYRWFE